MTTKVITTGGGTGDTASHYYLYGAGTDYVSQIVYNSTILPTANVPIAGNLSADLTTFNSTVRPISISQIQLRGGGTVSGYAGNATWYIQLATANTGAGGYNNSLNPKTTTGTIALYSTGAVLPATSQVNATVSLSNATSNTCRLTFATSPGTFYEGQYVFVTNGTGSLGSTTAYISNVNSATVWTITCATTPTDGTVTNVDVSLDWNILHGDTRYYGWYQTAGSQAIVSSGTTYEGTNIYRNGTVSFSGESLSGNMTVETLASAPGTPTASNVTGSSMLLSWSKPTDDGKQSTADWNDLNCFGFNIVYKKSTDTTWNIYGNGNTGRTNNSANVYSGALNYDSANGTYSYYVSGLSPATNYSFSVAAINRTSMAVSPVFTDIVAATPGTRSALANVKTAAGVYNGTAWVPPTVYVANSASYTINAYQYVSTTNTVTIQTSTAHGFSTGKFIAVRSNLTTPNLDTFAVITSTPNTTTFTYNKNTGGANTAGLVAITGNAVQWASGSMKARDASNNWASW